MGVCKQCLRRLPILEIFSPTAHVVLLMLDALAKEGVSVIRGRNSNRRTTGEDNPWGEHNAILQFLDVPDAGPSLSTLARTDEGGSASVLANQRRSDWFLNLLYSCVT